MLMLGPGKYDELCTLAREKAGITDGGGVIVIVFGGEHGNGFSVQADAMTMMLLPEILDDVARRMRDGER